MDADKLVDKIATEKMIDRVAAKDKFDVAAKMIREGDSLMTSLWKAVKELDKGFERAEKQLDGLAKAGGGVIDADKIIKGQILSELKNLGSIIKNAQDAAERIIK